MNSQSESQPSSRWFSRFLRLFDRLGDYDLATLVLVGLLAGGIWAFAALADEVLEQETLSFDRPVLLAMRSNSDIADPIGPLWVEEMMRDMTALGGIAWLTMLTLGVVGYLALRRKTHAMWLVIAAVVGGWMLSSGLKWALARPRPDLVPHGSHVYSASFPSGHSMMAAVTYLTLAALLARVEAHRRMKAYLLCLGIFLTLLTGISRVYLGVHWPTDVLAGWSLGAAWAIFCTLIARRLQRRGQIETPDDTPQPTT